jgi:hypothetical protein
VYDCVESAQCIWVEAAVAGSRIPAQFRVTGRRPADEPRDVSTAAAQAFG